MPENFPQNASNYTYTEILNCIKKNLNGFDELFALKHCTCEDVREAGLLAGHVHTQNLMEYLPHIQFSSCETFVATIKWYDK